MSKIDYFGGKYSALIISLILSVLTVAVYWQVGRYDFIHLDDIEYVTANPHVQSGLNSESVSWAFTQVHAGYWHPVTWLSHMLDCQLFGMNAGPHHLVNLFIHLVNIVLLVLLLRRMTGKIWQSGLVAALFALHPLHVESVAWIAERKDVLSTFFWWLTTFAYLAYLKRRSILSYIPIIIFFSIGLMAKPMLVTLPFTLLLLDYWPLNRTGTSTESEEIPPNEKAIIFRLVMEKAPLFVLVGIFSVVTFITQKSGGAIGGLSDLPMSDRISNALVSYVVYILKMFWPANLAVLYPHPVTTPVWQVAGAVVLLLTVSFTAIRWGRRLPYLPVGWFWYLGTLVPVIGIVQSGNQAMADRFTYVPLIGIYIIVAWGASDLARYYNVPEKWLAACGGILLFALMALSWNQLRFWQNTFTLFEHTLAITSRNYLIHNNLGTALLESGLTEEGAAHYRKALAINPESETTLNNLGSVLQSQGRHNEAIQYYQASLNSNPDYLKARLNLAAALLKQNQIEESARHYMQSMRIEPDNYSALYGMGNILARKGELNRAIEHYKRAVLVKPDSFEAYNNMGNTFGMQGRVEEAIKQYKKAIQIDANYADAHNNLGVALMHKGSVEDAIEHFETALRLDPNNWSYKDNLIKARLYKSQHR